MTRTEPPEDGVRTIFRPIEKRPGVPPMAPAREEIIENEIKYNNESYRRNYEPIGAAEMMRPISRSLGSLGDRQSDTDLDMPNGLGGRRVVVSIMLFVGHFFLQRSISFLRRWKHLQDASDESEHAEKAFTKAKPPSLPIRRVASSLSLPSCGQRLGHVGNNVCLFGGAGGRRTSTSVGVV